MILSQIRSSLHSFIRSLGWLYNSRNVISGKGCKFNFPIVLEGRGILIFGKMAFVGKRAIFRKGADSRIVFGDHCYIDNNVNISVATKQSLICGNNLKIEHNSKLYIHNEWKFGNNSTISTYCQIFSRESGCHGKLEIGDYSNIGDYSLIDVSGDIIIGNKVAIGPRCTIYTHDHNYSDKNAIAPWKGKPIIKPVIIMEGTWVGANVTILPGVIIGKNAIVAAGSVVTKDVREYTMVAGVPARVIKVINPE